MNEDFEKYYFNYDEDKNRLLKKIRGLDFKEIIEQINAGNIINFLDNPSKNYKNQKVLIIEIKDYVCVVPCVIDENKKEIFMKTAYKSRKHNKKYKKGE